MRIPRLFATAKDEPRSRRAGDAITLVAATIALLAISPAARPQPGFGRALERFIRSLPTFLLGGWQMLVDSLVLLAVVIVVAAAIRRRWSVVRDLVLAAIVAAVVSVGIVRSVHGQWPSFEHGWRSVQPPAWYPSIRLAMTAAVVMTASPHLALPVRRLGRWLIGFSAIAVAALGATSPLGAVAALLVAAGSAAFVHLVFGSSAGRPSLELVRDALAQLGVATTGLEVADRQTAGLFEVHRSDGGHRRYSRADLERADRARQLTDEGLSLDAVVRIVALEYQLAAAQAMIDILRTPGGASPRSDPG